MRPPEPPGGSERQPDAKLRTHFLMLITTLGARRTGGAREAHEEACGVREGDIIVYVNGWLITVMDKPQVYSMQCILFFVQTNGLSLPGCCEPIPSWSEHCDPGNLEGIRPAARHHCICSGPDPLRVRPLFLLPSYLPHF